MPRSVRTQEQTNARVTRQYDVWATGDGATVEFAIGKTLRRTEDLIVHVQGLRQRPADNTGPFDYDVRGFRPSVYAGEQNMVKFTAAPAVGVNICFTIHGD